MPDQFTHDVLVVGGGPAGSTAALLLQRLGLRVLLLEKNHFPRPKLCGGMLTHKTLHLLERIHNITLETLKAQNIPEFISSTYQLRIGDSLMGAAPLDPPFVTVNRSAFDAFLLQQARDAGAEILEGELVQEVNAASSWVQTESGKTFSARFILGADGVNSRVRRAFPASRVKPRRWKAHLAAGLEIYLPRSAFRSDLDFPIIHWGVLNWGYGWIFPNRERILVGVGGLAWRNHSMKAALTNFLHLSGWQGEPQGEILGYPVPYGNYLIHPVHGPLLLMGDAAGFADPFLGEGIYYAMRSAELAAACIGEEIHENGRVETTYPAALWRDFLRDFNFMMLLRPLLFGLSPLTGHRLVRLALNILGPRRSLELIQGTRSWRWFRKRKPADGE